MYFWTHSLHDHSRSVICVGKRYTHFREVEGKAKICVAIGKNKFNTCIYLLPMTTLVKT